MSAAVPELAPSGAAADDPVLRRALAAALLQLAGEIEVLGAALCGDQSVAEQHLGSLQSIDWCAQSLIQLALVLSAADPAQAVHQVTLGTLRDQLLAACQPSADRTLAS